MFHRTLGKGESCQLLSSSGPYRTVALRGGLDFEATGRWSLHTPPLFPTTMDSGSHGDGSNSNNDEDPTDVPHLISNLAVLEMLKTRVEARSERKISSRQHQHRDWLEAKVVEYLQGTAAVEFGTAQNAAALQKVLRSNKKTRSADGTVSTGYDLTKAESLQIINLAPKEPVEIHLLVEELHDRMTGRKQEELMSTIQSYLAPHFNGNSNHAATEDDAMVDRDGSR